MDAIYRSGRKGNSGDDPFPALLGMSNRGGFRYRGSVERLEMLLLTSNRSDPDWPDTLDRETGVFTYYGDNKVPGRALHETPRNGNALLQRIFEDAHGDVERRRRVPPIFLFAAAGEWRDVIFLGIAVPGAGGARPAEDLVAIWRVKDDRRFQNYRAYFTVLDTPVVRRSWINSLIAGTPDQASAPAEWRTWVETGRRIPLLARRSIEHRTRAEQMPDDAVGAAVIETIHTFFREDPCGFERCAGEITRMMISGVSSVELTRRSRDGGRDGIGRLRIGTGPGAILVDFALEAKCYGPANSVGVREMSRLISRLRHRQFGVLVTTSFIDVQAYREIKEDQHPIVVIAAADIVQVLRDAGYATVESIRAWLEREFPSAS